MTLFDQIKEYGSREAIHSNQFGTISYEDLLKKAKVISSELIPRSLTLIVTQNIVGCLVAYVAASLSDTVVIFVDGKTKTKHLLDIINVYDPDSIIFPTSFINNWDKTIGAYEKLGYVYNFEYMNLKVFSQNKKKLRKFNPELAVLLPTSGSMGSPKFVRLSHTNIKSNAIAISNYLDINPDDKTITNMSISYSYMFSIINSHLISGASLLVSERSMIDRLFWSEAKDFGITSLSGVPFIYETLLRLGLDNIWIPTIKYFTQAGGKLDQTKIKTILKFCSSKNTKFITMYGQTEASPRMAYLDWEYALTKLGSIGKAIPGTHLSLESDTKKEIITPHTDGEIVFRGKNVSLGYAENNNDLSKGDDNHGVLYTGDLGYFDKDYFFYITGRKKRIAKLFGSRINLDEIQDRMKLIGLEVVCLERDEKVAVFYEFDSSAGELLEKLAEVTGQSKRGFVLKPINKIPRTASLKINFLELDNYK